MSYMATKPGLVNPTNDMRLLHSYSRTPIVVWPLSNGDISNDLDGPLTRFSRSQHFWSWIYQKWCILGTKLLKNTIHNLSNGTIFNDSWVTSDPDSRLRHFLSRISKNWHILKTKLLLHSRKLPNIWNGTMFGDLDWPLNASHGFVSIRWASCFGNRWLAGY